MKIYNIYYSANGEIIEKQNMTQDEMEKFLRKLKQRDDHLLRIKKVGYIREEEER